MNAVLDYNLPYKPFMTMLSDIDADIYRRRTNVSTVDDYFPYIPIESAKVVRMLSSDKLFSYSQNYGFLDIGCGSGRVLAMVKYLTNLHVQGIEILSSIAKAGKKAYGVDIEIGDAFNIITPEFMEPYHILYTYMPIRNPQTMLLLHQHIVKNATHSALRVEMLPRYLGIEDVSIYIGSIWRSR